jgi:3-dehydroquinate dehydratase/shikimate kinase
VRARRPSPRCSAAGSAAGVVDTDREIERWTGRSVAEIFAEGGEAAFRDLERRVVVEVARVPDLVVALGGGTVLRDDTVADLLLSGVIVQLDVPVGVLAERLAPQREHRPLLRPGPDAPPLHEVVEEVLAARRARYAEVADLVVDASRRARGRRRADPRLGDGGRGRAHPERVRAGDDVSAPSRLELELDGRPYQIVVGEGCSTTSARRCRCRCTPEARARRHPGAARRARARRAGRGALADRRSRGPCARGPRRRGREVHRRARRAVGGVRGLAARTRRPRRRARWRGRRRPRRVRRGDLDARRRAPAGAHDAARDGRRVHRREDRHQPRRRARTSSAPSTSRSRSPPTPTCSPRCRSGCASRASPRSSRPGCSPTRRCSSASSATRRASAAATPCCCTALILRAAAIKARVVAADEREAGERAHLNLGHTYGHVLETLSGYGTFLHGEAVAVGLVVALEVGVELGRTPEPSRTGSRRLPRGGRAAHRRPRARARRRPRHDGAGQEGPRRGPHGAARGRRPARARTRQPQDVLDRVLDRLEGPPASVAERPGRDRRDVGRSHRAHPAAQRTEPGDARPSRPCRLRHRDARRARRARPRRRGAHGAELVHEQHDAEGELVAAVHRVVTGATPADAIVINAGALTHYGLSLRDALELVDVPCIELHLSNTLAREEFRHTSVIGGCATGRSPAFGAHGYRLAIDAAVALVGER